MPARGVCQKTSSCAAETLSTQPPTGSPVGGSHCISDRIVNRQVVCHRSFTSKRAWGVMRPADPASGVFWAPSPLRGIAFEPLLRKHRCLSIELRSTLHVYMYFEIGIRRTYAWAALERMFHGRQAICTDGMKT